MCGRYSLITPEEAVRRHFAYVGPPLNLAPRYNAAPTQALPVVRTDENGARRLAMLRWGLIPAWADDARMGARLINARAETAADKPAFRGAFRHRRCLVPADGFYEWERTPAGRRPYRVTPAGGGLFAFAGLWERWAGPDGPVESFTIVTTEAAPAVARLYPRMPAILDPADYAVWLDPTCPVDEARAVLGRALGGALAAAPVSARVNAVRNDDPAVLDPPGTDDDAADDDEPQARLL